MNVLKSASWHLSPARSFWGEIAPSDHVVQVYDNENILLDTLAGFVGGGINEGDTIIVIATSIHLKELEDKLESFGVHVDSLISGERYIPLDAKKTLAKFMVDGLPDRERFQKTISPYLTKALKRNRKVRAFGEMVALLWEEGNCSGTIALEELWNEFLSQNKLSLFCAYPKSLFEDDAQAGIRGICACHTKMILGNVSSIEHVYYKDVVPA